MTRSPRPRLYPRARLVILALALPSVAAAVIAGCGIADVGSLVYGDADDDASENVGANVPETGTADVDVGDGGIDASGDAQADARCDDSECVARGGACSAADNTCVFTCATAGSCAAGVVCPPGVPCRVSCSADDSCPGPIDCSSAASCDITCGKHACRGIACAGKTCAVKCTANDACDVGAINCTATESCDIDCTGGGGKTCNGPVTCTSSACSVRCGKDACKGGVTATAADASIQCGEDGCGPGATCFAQYCQLGCTKGSCSKVLCCDAGTCILDGGDNSSCPP